MRPNHLRIPDPKDRELLGDEEYWRQVLGSLEQACANIDEALVELMVRIKDIEVRLDDAGIP